VNDTQNSETEAEADESAALETTPVEATAATVAATQSFADLGVLPETVEALDALGITSPFPIQAATIPVALSGADVIGQAKTGTGKTLAFGIPMLQRVTGPGSDPDAAADTGAGAANASAAAAPIPAKSSGRRRRGRAAAAPTPGIAPAHGSPQALVVVPTRELATQVTNDLLDAGKVRAIRVHALYGGRAYEPQVAALRAGIDIAVGTPGRLLDLARQHHLELGGVRTLVLDEADEMLDLGFLPDVERIIAQLPTDRQTMLFSATMPGQVISLARRYMSRPTHIRAADPDDPGITLKNIAQFVYRAHSLDKIEILSRILQADGRGLAMVFARTKRTVAKIAEELADRHFAVAAVHGDLGQGAREQALRAFRNGKVDVLVATDVAARGIDVEGVTHVINFQCPEDEKVYTHRTGRTGRAGAKGTAVTFVDWDEVPRWGLINKALGLSIPEPAELYSTSPQLYSDLGIPAGVKGVLPRQERVREGLNAEAIEDLGETGRGRAPRSGGRGGVKDAKDSKDTPERQERAPRTPRQRTRTRRGEKLALGDNALTDGVAVSGDDVPTGSVAVSAVVAPVAEAAQVEEQAPRKRSRTRKAAVPAAGAHKAPAAATRRPASSVTGGSVKLAPGSLAGPTAETPVAKTAAKVAEKVAEKVAAKAAPEAAPKKTASTKVAAQKAPLDLAASDEAAPRKRTRTRKAAAPLAEATAADAVAGPAATVAVAPGDEEVNAGPVANPRRTRVRSERTRKAAAAKAETAAEADAQSTDQ
jgi:superfamily II DNA/RNA helicase